MEKPDPIIMYGCSWCSDTLAAQAVFEKLQITYTFIDIDRDETAAAKVMEINHGFRSVPTIIFPDGSVLVEPRPSVLKEKLIRSR